MCCVADDDSAVLVVVRVALDTDKWEPGVAHELVKQGVFPNKWDDILKVLLEEGKVFLAGFAEICEEGWRHEEGAGKRLVSARNGDEHVRLFRPDVEVVWGELKIACNWVGGDMVFLPKSVNVGLLIVHLYIFLEEATSGRVSAISADDKVGVDCYRLFCFPVKC